MKNEIEVINQNDKLTTFLDTMGLSSKLTEQEKSHFINIAQEFGLNPFKREIHCSVYGEGAYRQLSIITGYEVYIKRAERSGKLDGWEAKTTGSVENGDLKATVTIHRNDRKFPFVWEAFYTECVQRTKTGAVTKFWEKANFMTKKVGISQAFRLCFSDEIGGMPYTSDEMPDHTEDITHEIITPPTVQIPETTVAVETPTLTDIQLSGVVKKGVDRMQAILQAINEGKLTASIEQKSKLQQEIANQGINALNNTENE